MRNFVLEKLSGSNEIATAILSSLHVIRMHISFNFPTASTAISIIFQVADKSMNRISARSGSNIKHHSVFRVQILAYSLKKPSMRVYLSIVSLLYSEDEINSPSVRSCWSYTEIPCTGHKEMK